MSTAVVASMASAAMCASLLSASPSAAAAAPEARPGVQKTKSVPVSPVGSKEVARASMAKAVRSEPSQLPKRGKGVERALDGTWTDPAEGLSVRSRTVEGEGHAVTITPLGQVARSGATGVGPAFEIATGVVDTQSSDEVREAFEVKLNYSGFANAYGGDWAGRLRLVMLDDCVTTKSGVDCSKAKPLKTENDFGSQTLQAAVPASSSDSATMTMAATAAPSGSQGDFTASPLAASSNWSAGNQSGDFNWSFPLTAPPALNGPGPDLAIGYSSGAVDGKSSATNGQTSWVGEGFSLDPGFVERSYEPCRQVADDSGSNAPADAGDLCWRDDNLTMSLNGRTSELIRDGSSSQWRMKSDDGTRVEHLTSSGINDDNDGEYWRVTTTDGTRYYYGRNERFSGDTRPTNSVSTVPVYGSKAGEPCNESAFAASACDQGWRWGLDYVVDPHGNTMSFFYDQETNKYGSNKNVTVRGYDRASVLKSVEYGTRAGTENDSPAPAKVTFTTAERCISSTFDCTDDLTSSNASNWPEVPFDQMCTSTTSCADRTAPTFFSRKRLTAVSTFVVGGSGSYDPVNEWKLTQQLPATGDMSTDPDLSDRSVRTLWLSQIQQTGKAGTDVSLPPVTFNQQIMDNRVFDTNGVDAFRRYRVNAIQNGTGGSIAINYSPRDCTTASKPSASALDTNARRCFPVWFQPNWTETRQLEFFHKYRVDSVVESDNTGGARNKVTNYTYGGGDGWHFDDSNLERPKHRTWSEWRGYASVRTEVGAESGKTYADTFYLRGMHGDKVQAGGTRSVSVVDPLGDSSAITDKEEFAGFERRTRTRLGASGNIVDITVNDPWTSSATATQGSKDAHIVDVGKTEVRTRLSTGLYRTTSSATTFNGRGQAITVDDGGDTSTAADNRCTRTTYATNEAAGMFDYPATVVASAGNCLATISGADDVLSATRSSYDGGAPGASPAKGDVTTVESASGWSTGIDYQTDAVTTYDAYGRPTSLTDVKGEKSTTAFAPSSGPVDTVTTTNPLGQVSTMLPNRAWGTPTRATDIAGAKTDYTYDALGRVTSVWGPGRNKDAGQSATVKYSYRVSSTAPNAVTTETLNNASAYVTTVAFFDGLLRERETQAPSPGSSGGRVITEKKYDDRGWLISDRGPYFNSATVDTTLVSAAENAIPGYTNFTHDLAGRVTKQSLASLGGIKWSTSTSYGGDRTLVTPPAGGTATTTVVDARGQTTSLTQHTGATPTGAGDVTTYRYTLRGELSRITDSSGTVWNKTYDIRGQLVSDDDPDKGLTTFTYDDLGRQVTSTDARGFTLWTGYDEVGRKTELRDDAADGVLRSSWKYDTVRPGVLTSSTRHAGGQDYTSEVTAFDAAGRPTSSRVLIPASEGLLYRSGGHVTGMGYNVDGSVRTVAQPLVYGITNENLIYTYDALGNVKTMTGVNSVVSDVIYSPLGEVLQRVTGTTGKSVYDSREYEDATRRVSRRWVSLQGTATTPRLDLRYTYDNAGNVKKLNEVAAGDTAQTSTSTMRQCFNYDYLRRMTTAHTSSTNSCVAPTTANLGTVAPYWDGFTFAKSGNRTKAVSVRKPGSALVSTTHTSTFPDPTADRPHAVTSTTKTGGTAGTESFAYDEAGSLSKRSTASTAGKSIEFDREGHQKTVTDLATGKTTEYLYDTEGNRLLERNSAEDSVTLFLGSTEMKVKAGVRSTMRTYSVGGESVATRDTAGLKLMATDHQGTPLLSVNAATQAFDKRRYTPFGELLQAPAAAWPSTRGFLNKTTDSSTGTTHVGAREYDPAGGRFISVDPIMDPMDPQQMNGYAYANNSPVTSSDPTGLYVPCEGASCPGGQGTVYNPKNPTYQAAYNNNQAKVKKLNKSASYKLMGLSASVHDSAYQQDQETQRWIDGVQRQQKVDSVLAGIARLGFDERSCEGGVDVGCGAEFFMAVFPFGKGAKALNAATDALKATKSADEGIYVVRSEAGTYVGQSGNITQRLSRHVYKNKFTQAEAAAAERIYVRGGKVAREVAEQLKIDEFGGIENLVNQVNPIGPRRFDFMPNQPYTR